MIDYFVLMLSLHSLKKSFDSRARDEFSANRSIINAHVVSFTASLAVMSAMPVLQAVMTNLQRTSTACPPLQSVFATVTPLAYFASFCTDSIVLVMLERFSRPLE